MKVKVLNISGEVIITLEVSLILRRKMLRGYDKDQRVSGFGWTLKTYLSAFQFILHF